jgi:hypothetical protein
MYWLEAKIEISVIASGRDSLSHDSSSSLRLTSPGTVRISSTYPSISRTRFMSTSNYHVFGIPSHLLETLTIRNLIGQEPTTPPSVPVTTLPSIHGARSCSVCLGTVFVDVDEQRTHFRSDWHRYNVKVHLNGGPPVTEPEFAQLVDGMCWYSLAPLSDCIAPYGC